VVGMNTAAEAHANNIKYQALWGKVPFGPIKHTSESPVYKISRIGGMRHMHYQSTEGHGFMHVPCGKDYKL